MHKVWPREAQEKPTKGFTEIIYSVAALKEELGFVFVSLINLHLELFREVFFYVFHHMQMSFELQWHYVHNRANFALQETNVLCSYYNSEVLVVINLRQSRCLA